MYKQTFRKEMPRESKPQPQAQSVEERLNEASRVHDAVKTLAKNYAGKQEKRCNDFTDHKPWSINVPVNQKRILD